MSEGDITVYGNLLAHLWNGRIDWLNDTIKVALLAGHTPAPDVDDYFDDVSADEESGTGTGYTAGGETLTGKSVTYTPANSFGTTWAASTAYKVGDIVRPTTGNGYVYRCFVAGTTGASEPTWSTTKGDNVADGTAEWEVWGTGILRVDCADPSWAGLDVGTPSHAVFYKDTGAAATSPLICVMEISTASNGGNYTIAIDALGLLTLAVN